MRFNLDVEIEGLPEPVNKILWTHWTVKKKHTDMWKKKVFVAIGQNKPVTPLKKAKLTLTRYSSRESDFDGLVGSFKPITDALISCGVIEDDKPSVIGRPEYVWEKVKPKEGKIRIQVEEAS